METLARRVITTAPRRPLRVAALVLGLVLLLAIVGFTRIEPGHVGIKAHYGGGQRGVEDFPTQIGWVFYIRGFSTVLEWPVFTQTVIWTRSV
jgi:hypothetical protein